MNLLWLIGVALNILSMGINWKLLEESDVWPVHAIIGLANATCLCYLLKF